MVLAVGEHCGLATLADIWCLVQMVAPKLMAEDSANNYLQRSGSEEISPAESLENTPTAAEATALQGPFLRISVFDTPQEPDRQPEPQALPSPQPPRVCMTRLQDQEHQLLPQISVDFAAVPAWPSFPACSFCLLHSRTQQNSYLHVHKSVPSSASAVITAAAALV